MFQEEGVVVFAVGIGSQTNKDELEAIASSPTENYLFEVGNYDLLKIVKEKLAVKACEGKHYFINMNQINVIHL